MAKKHEHEDHVNHEAWAIPYGDLVTLLLAFFVVMYAVSSVNAGKYRVLSDSLSAAFRGTPKTLAPISVGETVAKVKRDESVAGIKPNQAMEFKKVEAGVGKGAGAGPGDASGRFDEPGAQLREVASDIEIAMQSLIDKDMIRVTRAPEWVEVEIKTDILFPSGSADVQQEAVAVMERVADVLKGRTNPIRVEGHTDNRPIRTALFPSNWELSAARAARIVRLFQERGIGPARLVVAGMGDQRPLEENATVAGRNRNRRVTLVILGEPDSSPAAGPAAPQSPPADPALSPLPASTSPVATAAAPVVSLPAPMAAPPAAAAATEVGG
jgi:chemotaxis protein MotB